MNDPDQTLTKYISSPEHDMLLAKWWEEMIRQDELLTILTSECQAISQFFGLFQFAELVFEFDEEGIWLAAWFDPVMSGAFMSLWTRKDKRGTREQVKSVHNVYTLALQAWPILLGVTKQERLLKIHKKIGYNVLGKVEYLFDGEDAWLLKMTQKSFKGVKAHGRKQCNRKRGSEGGEERCEITETGSSAES